MSKNKIATEVSKRFPELPKSAQVEMIAKILKDWPRSPKSAARAAREVGVGITTRDFKKMRDLRENRRWKTISSKKDVLLTSVSDRLESRKDELARKRRDLRVKNKRKNLLSAGRVARKLFWSVKTSTDREGRVSSYYATKRVEDENGRVSWRELRISDHEIPWTSMRELRAHEHGDCYDGWGGCELVIDGKKLRSSAWMRRALLLAIDGRNVPGAKNAC